MRAYSREKGSKVTGPSVPRNKETPGWPLCTWAGRWEENYSRKSLSYQCHFL